MMPDRLAEAERAARQRVAVMLSRGGSGTGAPQPQWVPPEAPPHLFAFGTVAEDTPAAVRAAPVRPFPFHLVRPTGRLPRYASINDALARLHRVASAPEPEPPPTPHFNNMRRFR